MADLTVSANVDTLLQAANFAVFKTSLAGASFTFAGAFTTSGAFTIGLTASANTALTLPTTGTLSTLTGTETFTNKTITAPVLGGTITGTYTIGGTPTFPSSVVTLTGTQTLTNKSLTAPSLGTPLDIVLTNATGAVATTALTATGTKNSTTFLRGDNTWDVPAGSGTGDVTGPGSSTDNAVARFDSTTGKLIQNGVVIIGDTGNVTGIAALTLTSLIIGATTLTASGAELNFVTGVTSAIQTQLNTKQATITFGTGVQTALGVNVGSAGAPVLVNGVLGTPSSGTVTNLTGTASININGTVGATTPAAGTFTTVVAGSTTSILVGTAGSAVGNIGFRNATSGTATLSPPTGALGTYTVTLPNAASTLPIYPQQITYTGPTAARTVTLPDANFTVARTDAANTFTGVQTMTSPVFVTPVLGTPTSGNAANMTADGTNLIGYRGAPQQSKSADYTLILGDAGFCIFHPVGDNNARAFTIPANGSVAYPIGTIIEFVNMAAASCTIPITTDTLTLLPAGTTGTRTLAQYGRASAEKITSTSWIISGNSALT